MRQMFTVMADCAQSGQNDELRAVHILLQLENTKDPPLSGRVRGRGGRGPGAILSASASLGTRM